MSLEENNLNRLNREVQYLIIYSKAASIQANLDAIYPESLVIGLLTMGPQNVSKELITQNIDLQKALIFFKDILKNNRVAEDISLPSCNKIYNHFITDQIFEHACSLCQKIKHDSIGVEHIFISILQLCHDILTYFENLGFNFEDFQKKVLANFSVASSVSKVTDKKINTKDTNENKNAYVLFNSVCVDMTKKAYDKNYDPVLLRDSEIEELITILCRKNKSNPILVGYAGVGKTAVVEGVCQMIASQTVPPKLLNAKVFSLDINSLLSGTKYRGEFESRLKMIISVLKENKNYILFIDEIHNIMGAGNSSGALDAANILKPELARGLKCIGATTVEEYNRFFSKDAALNRRFEKIYIEEPDEAKTLKIVTGIKSGLEEYHKCHIPDECIEMAIKLSARYNHNKKFPDKAIDCIDTACAKYAWQDKNNLQTTTNDIAMVISKQCKIPLELILWSNYERTLNVESFLSEKIKGQDHVVKIISRVIRSSYSGVRSPNRPIGVFVLGGQSGTGKTYTAQQLSKAIFDSESSFIRVDMSEYSEEHSLSKIIGSPPGYVGFQDQNIVANKIRERPYCVLLLDEIEKAHPKTIKLFLQVMKDGFFTDSSGNYINCKNCIIIMTGNFNLALKAKQSIGFSDSSDKSDILDLQKNRMIKFCKDAYGDEFCNRVDEFVPFNELCDKDICDIFELKLNELIERVSQPTVKISYDKKVINYLFKLMRLDHGRNGMLIERLIAKNIEPVLADALLEISQHTKTYNSSFKVKLFLKKDIIVYKINMTKNIIG